MPASRILNNDNMFAYDHSIGVEVVVADGRSMTFTTHTHIATLNFLVVRNGRIRLSTESGEYLLSAGDTLTIFPHQAHGLQGLGRFTIATLSLKSALFKPDLSGKQRSSVRCFLNAMVARGTLTAQEQSIFMKSSRNTTYHNTEKNDSLKQLRVFLETNPEYPVTLKDMAQKVHTEKCHFIRRFKNRYGITPHSFITQNRLRKARQRLMEHHSLTESALMSGFYDQSHFIRNFKKLHGMTPSDYVRACHPMPNTAGG